MVQVPSTVELVMVVAMMSKDSLHYSPLHVPVGLPILGLATTASSGSVSAIMMQLPARRNSKIRVAMENPEVCELKSLRYYIPMVLAKIRWTGMHIMFNLLSLKAFYSSKPLFRLFLVIFLKYDKSQCDI